MTVSNWQLKFQCSKSLIQIKMTLTSSKWKRFGNITKEFDVELVQSTNIFLIVKASLIEINITCVHISQHWNPYQIGIAFIKNGGKQCTGQIVWKL